MKNKKLFFLLSVILLSFLFLFSFSQISFAADPKLITTLKKAFESIQSWLLKLATPAAAVAVRNRSIYEKI